MISNSIYMAIANKSKLFTIEMKLSIPVLQDLQYYNITADISSEYVAKDTVFGKYFRNYYNVSFEDKYKIDYYAKNFNVNKIYVIQRNELISADMIIINKQLIVRNTNEVYIEPDENVLFLAKDYNNNFVIYICYNGLLYNTSISPNQPIQDVEYKVLLAFQLWDIENINNLKQVFPNMKDSPLTGHIRFNNLDNELIV